MKRTVVALLLSTGLAAAVALADASSARADGYYYAPPSYYIAPYSVIPSGYHVTSYYHPAPPVMVYEAAPVVVPAPAAVPVYDYYGPAYGAVEKHRWRPRSNNYKYKYKLYSPYGGLFGPKKVYEYEYKFNNGRVRIDEDFD